MLKDVLVPQLCDTCRYLIEREENASLSLNGKDYYKVNCSKDNCENGSYYQKESHPKSKIIPKEEPTKKRSWNIFKGGD